jgi:molecular chaperone GrpE
MAKAKDKKKNTEKSSEKNGQTIENMTEEQAQELSEEQIESDNEEQGTEKEIQLEKELAEYKDKYIRLYSEFDNFRRRSIKEKSEIIQTANERLINDLIPTIDDFERAEKSFDEAKDLTPIKEGVNIIHQKLVKTLEAKGVKRMESKGEVMDTEKHEAITQIPVEDEALKGKIVDVIEEGYYLNDKVIRFAKVVIGQ